MKKELTPIARNLRKRMTDAEIKLWRYLRRKQPGAKFRRQCQIGKYIVDFVSFDASVVVKVDGGQHVDSESDMVRDEWLASQGFKVLRFWNNDVLKNIEAVIGTIRREIPPPPVGRD
jgi:very-short-patch-repair endonuclease